MRCAPSRHLRQDAADVGQEAHVEHVVGLVEHHHLERAEVGVAPPQVVEEAAGTRHDDLGAAAQRGLLLGEADAAVDGGAAQARVLAELAGLHVDLLGQLPGGRHDQGAQPAARAVQQTLEDGQDEGGGLAGAGLGQAQHVASLERGRQRALLDGGRVQVACRSDARLDAGIEVVRFESQRGSLLAHHRPRGPQDRADVASAVYAAGVVGVRPQRHVEVGRAPSRCHGRRAVLAFKGCRSRTGPFVVTSVRAPARARLERLEGEPWPGTRPR